METASNEREKEIKLISTAPLSTRYGNFLAYAFEATPNAPHYLALVKGDVKDQKRVLVRMHSECLTGDLFGSKRCDCGSQLDLSLKKIASEERGIFIYMRGHEGRGIGLGSKLSAYCLQDLGFDTVEANLQLGFPADAREYVMGALILNYFAPQSIRLLTNNPEKFATLIASGLNVIERISLVTPPTEENRNYLFTKKAKMGHLLDPIIN